jgi:O-antigen/teichoic acid export membrane protein
VPLGLVTALIALQTSLPRYFLAIHQGESVVGHLTVLSHFLIAGAIVNGAFQQSVGPRLAKYFAARRRERFIFAVVVLCGASVGLGLAGLCIVVPFGPAILRLVYGPVYVEFADTLPWLMVAGIASYALGAVSTALTVMRRLASQAVAAALSALVCGVTSWMWVPIHGVKGAVWAIGAAGSANLMVTGFVLVREFLVSGSDLSMKPQRPVLGSNLK